MQKLFLISIFFLLSYSVGLGQTFNSTSESEYVVDTVWFDKCESYVDNPMILDINKQCVTKVVGYASLDNQNSTFPNLVLSLRRAYNVAMYIDGGGGNLTCEIAAFGQLDSNSTYTLIHSSLECIEETISVGQLHNKTIYDYQISPFSYLYVSDKELYEFRELEYRDFFNID